MQGAFISPDNYFHVLAVWTSCTDPLKALQLLWKQWKYPKYTKTPVSNFGVRDTGENMMGPKFRMWAVTEVTLLKNFPSLCIVGNQQIS